MPTFMIAHEFDQSRHVLDWIAAEQEKLHAARAVRRRSDSYRSKSAAK